MGAFQMQALSRSLLAYDMTADPWITGVVGVGWVPSLTAFSLFGSMIGDRFDRRTVLLLTHLGMAFTTLAVTLLLYLESLEWWHLFASSFAQGGLFAVQAPARYAAVPMLVSPRRTSNALALLALASTLMTMVAPAAAGVLYGAIGARGTFATISAMLVAATVANLPLQRLPPPGREATGGGGACNAAAAAIAGLRYALRNRTITLLLLQLVVGAVLTAPVRFLLNVPAEELLLVGPSGAGALLAASGIGGIAATIFVAGLRPGQPRGLLTLLTAVTGGAALLLFAATRSYLVALLAMCVVGLGELAPRTLATSLIVELSPEELRARVSGVTVLAFAATGIGQLSLGALMRNVGVAESLWIFAIVMTAVASLLLLGRPVRQLR